MTVQECSSNGSCTSKQGGVTLDSNWRWTHTNTGYTNCYTGNTWDATLCPTPQVCATNCALEGVPSSDWTSPYGVSATSGGIELKLVTVGSAGANVGSRTYMVDGDNYMMFKLKNREFSVDVDVSNLPCGVNGALYFVEMEKDGGKSAHSTNKAGAKYGTGYCDAQCPHDIKWINGEANSNEWKANPNDKNSGIGHFGACCAELDIWEANSVSSAYTVHPCGHTGLLRCEG